MQRGATLPSRHDAFADFVLVNLSRVCRRLDETIRQCAANVRAEPPVADRELTRKRPEGRQLDVRHVIQDQLEQNSPARRVSPMITTRSLVCEMIAGPLGLKQGSVPMFDLKSNRRPSLCRSAC